MRFQVITKIGSIRGNLAMIWPLYTVDPNDRDAEPKEADPASILIVRAPVFEVGQLLIVNDDGREVGYPGRKASKWDVDYEIFDTPEEAVARARAAMEGST